MHRVGLFKQVADNKSNSDSPGIEKKETQRKSAPYKTHQYKGVRLSFFQEFLLWAEFLRQGTRKKVLAHKWFGESDPGASRVVNCILRTWICALYSVLSAEDWWVYPEHIDRTQSKAFAHDFAKLLLALSDCTNINCQGSRMSELIAQQLFSLYYKHTCGKYNVTCSRIGGCVAVSPGMGGPATDHRCMEAAGLFQKRRWKVPTGVRRVQLGYDAGISQVTKAAARRAGFEMVTSGTPRNSAKSNKSHAQRDRDQQFSTVRIRVENFIGIVKKRFRVLYYNFPIADLAIMDKIVYICFMLHNFGPPIFK
jgi:hypothetical protein